MKKFQSMSSEERVRFWKETLDAYHKCDRSIQEFCSEREIGVSSLLGWQRKLKKLEVQSEAVAIRIFFPSHAASLFIATISAAL